MKNPREIYAAYKTMPALQLHQLRVAAVGKLICDNFSSKGGSASGGKNQVNERDVVLACLFHDMGNILKFDLVVFPEFTQPEGAAYWESVKAEYRVKYGDDEHAATQAIMEELELPESVKGLMKGIGFSQVDRVAASESVERKIIQYCDLRVGPRGVLSLQERLDEGRKRYLGTNRSIGASNDGCYKILVDAALKVEMQIFAETKIRPEDINDATVAPLIEELWEYPLA